MPARSLGLPDWHCWVAWSVSGFGKWQSSSRRKGWRPRPPHFHTHDCSRIRRQEAECFKSAVLLACLQQWRPGDRMTTSSIIADLTKSSAETIAGRVDHLDWQRITKGLGEEGSAMLLGILSPRECRSVAALYPDDHIYRSRVVMGRHGFGKGEYKYFKYPLPALIQNLRAELYPRLVPIANSWNEAMGVDAR